MNRQDDAIWTETKLAEAIGMEPHTVASWRYDGTGPKYFRVGGRRTGKPLYLLSDVLEWIETRKYQSTLEEFHRKYHPDA